MLVQLRQHIAVIQTKRFFLSRKHIAA